jgi:hypothetical protein
MSAENPNRISLESDAQAIEEKYGPFAAEVYAENRAEAADLVGNRFSKGHWQKVAEKVRNDDQ